MRERISVKQEASVIGSYDTVICGGGPAGIMAAVSAAKNGARTALIERYGFLGGMATAGYVLPISEFCKNAQQVIGGLPWDFVKLLETMKGAEIEYPIGNVSFNPETYKLAAQRLVLEAGVTLYLHSYVSGCILNGKRITHVIINNKNGPEAIEGRYFIDCTGDADLAVYAGVPMQPLSPPDTMLPASMCFLLSGVDTEALGGIHHQREKFSYDNQHIKDFLDRLRSKQTVPLFGGPWFCSTTIKDLVAVNMTRISANMADNREQTRAECQLREDVHRLISLLKENFPPFKNCNLVATGVQAGIRETRRIAGAYILSGGEYLAATKFDDAVSRAIHPIDIHSPTHINMKLTYLEEAGYIPYRSLIVPEFPNYFAAGRCISVDFDSSASIRVQAPVMELGQAAGMAAALCVKNNVSTDKVDIQELRTLLRKGGSNI
jgi:hypothetical protein